MSLPFARSERSLKADDYRTATIILLLATPLFIVWLFWFFTGDIALLEVSLQVARLDDNTVIATYPDTEAFDPHIGGEAQLRIQSSEHPETVILPAFVSDVTYNDNGTIDLHIYLAPETGAILPEELIGQAEVEINSVSPATFLWRLTGQQIDTSPINYQP